MPGPIRRFGIDLDELKAGKWRMPDWWESPYDPTAKATTADFSQWQRSQLETGRDPSDFGAWSSYATGAFGGPKLKPPPTTMPPLGATPPSNVASTPSTPATPPNTPANAALPPTTALPPAKTPLSQDEALAITSGKIARANDPVQQAADKMWQTNQRITGGINDLVTRYGGREEALLQNQRALTDVGTYVLGELIRNGYLQPLKTQAEQDTKARQVGLEYLQQRISSRPKVG